MAENDFQMGAISQSQNDNSHTIALAFYKVAGDADWQNEAVNFDRIPSVGEYVTFSRDGDWYEVKAVVHMGFPLDYDAEIYCIEVTDKLALRRAFGE